MHSNFRLKENTKPMLVNKAYAGFTLIETVIGIVVLSIAFSIMTTLIYPAITKSADQIHQIRAAELGQSLLNEIQGRAFDQNSDMAGGIVRCGETGAANCTAQASLGNEEADNRSLFNDVDDYNNLLLKDSLNNDLSGIYKGYSVSVTVTNDSDYDGSYDGVDNIAKLITVVVTTPTGQNISFSTYKANF